MRTRARWIVGVMAMVVAGAMSTGCDAGRPPIRELRFRTDSFVIRVAPEVVPTRAWEPTYWRVVIHDRETGTPIQGGQGRIFGTNQDRKTVSNGLEETGEIGTYRSNLMFVTAGMWAMAIQFRRDSTQVLQKTQDWTQDVLAAEEPGDFTPPPSTRAPEYGAPPAAPATPSRTKTP